VISEQARAQVLEAYSRALAAGFEPIASGGVLSVAAHEGFYVRPSIARAPSVELQVPGYTDHELFAPDLAIYVARDESEALEVAGRGRYGLTAGVFTASAEAFERAVDVLRVGLIGWNRPTAGASGRLPFGGAMESGNHRPAGILMGLSCTQPVGVFLAPKAIADRPDSLPVWPGMGL
jgi:succinylglutamic semialdehyde dehydrogenase